MKELKGEMWRRFLISQLLREIGERMTANLQLHDQYCQDVVTRKHKQDSHRLQFCFYY